MEQKAPIELSPKARKAVVVGDCSMAVGSWLIQLCFSIALPGLLKYYDIMKYQGTLLTIASVVGAVCALLGGRIGDSIGRKNFAIITCAARIVILALLLVRSNGTIFMILYILIISCNSLMGSIQYAIANDISTEMQKPKLVGLLGTFNGISMIVGIFFGGLLIDMFDPFVLFWIFLFFNIPAVILFALFFKNKKNDEKLPILPFYILKNKQFLFNFIFTICILSMVYLASTGLSLFGSLSLELSTSVVGTLALPKNILFLFLPTVFGAWMAKNLKNYGKVCLLCGITIAIGSVFCALWTTETPVILIYLTMIPFGIATSCQVVFLNSYYTFFLPHSQIGAASSMIGFASSIGMMAMSYIYTFVYNRNYEAYTAEGGLGLGKLVNISYRAVAVAGIISGIVIIVLRFSKMYKNPGTKAE